MTCISNPKNQKSKAICARHQLSHVNYFKEKVKRSPSIEVMLCDYFASLYDSTRFLTGAFWCTCSTLRAHALRAHGVNEKNCIKLKTLLKKFAIDHVKKKSDAFSFEDMKGGLTALLDKSNRKDLLIITGKHH